LLHLQAYQRNVIEDYSSQRLAPLISQNIKQEDSTESKWGNKQQTDSGTETASSPDRTRLIKKSSVQPLISKATQLWKTSSLHPTDLQVRVSGGCHIHPTACPGCG